MNAFVFVKCKYRPGAEMLELNKAKLIAIDTFHMELDGAQN